MIRSNIIQTLLPAVILITTCTANVVERSRVTNISLTQPHDVSNNYQNIAIKILKQDDLDDGIKISKKNKLRKNLPNKHVLAKLGVKKVAVRDSLGGQFYNDKSESNLVIVKLPPNPNYYVNLQPCDEKNNKNCLSKSPKNMPFSFNINGKPSKIYHYNLPLVDKTQKRNIDNRTRSSVSLKVLSHKRQTKNNISVYQPLPNSLPAMNSYFSGNGKFQSLYVMSKKKKRKYSA